MNMWKPKLKTQYHVKSPPKKIKHLGINLTKHIQDLSAEKSQNDDERNQRSKMEKCMFMDQKTQFSPHCSIVLTWFLSWSQQGLL